MAKQSPAAGKRKPTEDDLMMEIDEEELMDALDPLEGLTFVLSGEFETVSRPRLEQLIKEKGGRTT